MTESDFIAHGSTYEAVIAVMREIEVVAKARKADQSQGGYAFRGIEELLTVLGPACRRHGLITTMVTGELDMTEYQTKGGARMHWARLDVEVHFRGTADPEDVIVARAVGEAGDTGDKAVAKAESVGYREIMFKTFCVPTSGQGYDTEDDGEDKAAAGVNEERAMAEAARLAGAQARGWEDLDDLDSGWEALKEFCSIEAASGEWCRAWVKTHGIKLSNFTAAALAEIEVTMANAKKDGGWKAGYEPPAVEEG